MKGITYFYKAFAIALEKLVNEADVVIPWLWKTDVSENGDDGESFISGNTSDFSEVTQGSNHSSFLESTSGDSFNLSLASFSTGLTPSSLGSGSEATSAASSDVGR